LGGRPTLVKSLETRFLYPFFYQPHRIKEATAALRSALVAGRSGVWTCADARGLYKEEVLDHVTDFLFASDERTGCRYLRVADDAVQGWFRGTKLLLKDGDGMPVNPVPEVKVELFLSDYGVGVFSLALTPDPPDHALGSGLDQGDVLTFNYKLAQFQRWSAAPIHVPHPGEDPEALARLPEHDRARLSPIPPADAPLVERLGKRGGTFTLSELVRELLRPLEELGLEPTQPIFSVYTIALFGPEVDFGLPDARDRLGPFLSALAQVEEKDHAGAPPGIVGVPNAVLNRKHWAAVGQLGAAHLIADQPDDYPFNAARLPRVRDKYFIQYLLALLQRLVVHRTIDRAEAILEKSGPEREAALEALRGDLLQFAVGGHFTQVSIRHALHRFYNVAREGLDVPAAWSEVRRAIADIDARLTQQRQEKLADGVALNLKAMAEVADDLGRVTHKMDENLGIVAGVQRMVHYIEMAIVSVYFAHLWHMFADNESLKQWVDKMVPYIEMAIVSVYFAHFGHTFADNESLNKWIDEKTLLHGAGDWFVSIGVLVWAAIGFGFALLLGRVLHRRTVHGPSPDHLKSPAPDELIARLDLLDLRSPDIRDGFHKAVRLASDDPEMAVTRARKVLEHVVRDVFVRRVKEPPGTRPLENLLQRLVKDGHLPERLCAYADIVRKLGSIGMHQSDETVTADDARTSLSQLMPILEWYSATVREGVDTSGSTKPTIEAR